MKIIKELQKSTKRQSEGYVIYGEYHLNSITKRGNQNQVNLGF